MEVTQGKFSSDFQTIFFPAQLKLDLLALVTWELFQFFATELTGASVTEWFGDAKIDDVTACRHRSIHGKKKGSKKSN